MKKLSNGVSVLLGLSEPWDFVTNNGATREGIIREIWGMQDNPTVVAIELLVPVCIGDICVSLVYAYGRYSDGFAGLTGGSAVSCNFSEVFDKTNAPKSAIAFLGDLRLS